MGSILHVRIPLVRDGDSVDWQKFATISSLRAVDEDNSFALLTENGDRVGFPDEVKQWIDENRIGEGEWLLKNAILNLSTVSVEGDTVRVAPREPNRPGRAPWEATFRSSLDHTPALEYTGPLSSVLSAQLPFVSVNRNHPLIESALAAQHREDRSEVQQFLVSAAYCLSNDSTLNALSKLDSSVTYQMQRVGQRYLDVDWSGVIDYLTPPYKVWLREHGEVEVSQQDFERWAASNMDDI